MGDNVYKLGPYDWIFFDPDPDNFWTDLFDWLPMAGWEKGGKEGGPLPPQLPVSSLPEECMKPANNKKERRRLKHKRRY
jgi:hypothetical protein